MVKPLIFLFISWVMLAGLCSHTQADPQWCLKKETFPGGCGERGGYQCFLDFLNKYGAGGMPKGCSCRPAGRDQRLCACEVVCQEGH
uniref:Defensin-like protein n=1 Tax=Salix viminalis TaxID=40686 RepID=A0A6N2N6M9_SALVM